MVCDNCKKYQATVYFEQIINDEKTEMNLCQKCSLDFTTPMFFNNSLQNLLFNINVSDIDEEKLKCTACGLKLSEFKKIGKLGCGTCYDIFKDELMPLFKNIQYGLEHVGKFPKKSAKSLIAIKEIEKLKIKLNQAIVAEEYEQAAKFRDQIKSLQKESEG